MLDKLTCIAIISWPERGADYKGTFLASTQWYEKFKMQSNICHTLVSGEVGIADEEAAIPSLKS